ncbi:tungsten ABC transporter substrate-binding protein [Brevibacillus reuszeri]|uniref:Tungsten ABC transporter substrate-binding protein n=1 Tax=Brevibacillus reuszeri TaxID=54915 RepID=A0A0K9YYD5_9BACL|nr:substrate-binding domain-containing protein [Brevibacillus reuszeri]KNB73657.1 tungsten ABC transporter substrate-binding protein [Brevibacillus reuszeri]MED1858535.1 substrate-binding domain-containing protein [Brevibacillus reuszeri]GED69510.1 tungsten ABC transporter substrate-binding protein [Brevibacillus reuszeri]
MVKKFSFVYPLFLVLVLMLLAACTPQYSQSSSAAPSPQSSAPSSAAKETKEIILATTTSTQDSGLLDSLLPVFEQKTGIKVKVVAVGTGQAIKLGEDGNADVLLVHARKSEDEFMEKGFGINAYDVMYNQFYIVGPSDDPAGLKQTKTAKEAMEKIAEKKSSFVSRGDDSGTDKKEKSIWKEAGIKPEGNWYLSSGQGMGETLQMADEKKAYTLTDEATFLSRKLGLEIVMQGDKSLLNPYGIIQVKSSSKQEEGMQLIQFFTGEEGQKLIGEFGQATYGKGLFVPDAKKR